MKVIGISGSLSEDSSTTRLLGIVMQGAQSQGAETEVVDLRNFDLPFCDGRDDYESYPEIVQKFRGLVRGASGIILASPEYHNSLSGALKNALDLLTTRDMSDKMCGLLGVAGGGHGAINALNSLRLICRAFGAWVVPQQVSVSRIGEAFDEQGGLRDPALERRLRHLGEIVAVNSAKLQS